MTPSDDVEPGPTPAVDSEATDHGSEQDQGENQAEERYRRRIGIVLALLAILGAWMAILATDASTKESTATREATRQAVQAQRAKVLADGASATSRQIDAELETLLSTPVMADPVGLGATLGFTVDPERAATTAEESERYVETSIEGGDDIIRELSETAAALALEQATTVEARIAWNAKASQYETVLTTLAIAVFLVGFTLVIGRRLRPPVAIPGVLLAIYCIGWAGVIHSHPVPHVEADAVAATAAGQVAMEEGRPGDAVGDFTTALEIEPEYLPALSGQALATLVLANPDLTETMAVTDTSSSAIDPAVADLETATDNGGLENSTVMSIDALTLTLAGRWDAASTALGNAIELNPEGAELYLWRAAVEVALGNIDDSEKWLAEAQERFHNLDLDRQQALVGQYMTVLEIVAVDEPSQTAKIQEMSELVVGVITAEYTGRPIDPDEESQGTVEILEARFADDKTTVLVDTDGVSDGADVAIVGYERPAPDANWVQPSELLYFGPPPSGDQATELDTPRHCVAVEYRFDLYVEGKLVDSATAPGGQPTC